jgi:hypothetical protein
VLVAFAVSGLAQSAHGQSAKLVVYSDFECRLRVDENPGGVLKPGAEASLKLSPGEHRIEAVPLSGGIPWRGTVTLTGKENRELHIRLPVAAGHADASDRGYWVDSATHLYWTAADNGFGVSWAQASSYCTSLQLGGLSDWTLPAIEDLHHLFGGPPDASGHHVAAPLKLTGWEWSATAGAEPGERWALDFGDGARASVVTGDSGLNRALCVRRAEK